MSWRKGDILELSAKTLVLQGTKQVTLFEGALGRLESVATEYGPDAIRVRFLVLNLVAVIPRGELRLAWRPASRPLEIKP